MPTNPAKNSAASTAADGHGEQTARAASAEPRRVPDAQPAQAIPPTDPARIAYVALGANLGDPTVQIHDAVEALAGLPHSRLLRASSLYRTAPIGVHGQPDFINAVVALETSLAPETLLDALLAIEANFGRRRDYPNAPRTLDLDLLLYGDRTIDTPALKLPHPRMHLRAFVIAPLLEIAPDCRIPGRGAAAAWLPAVRTQKIERIDPETIRAS